MFMNSSKLLFFIILIMGTMISISSNSWFSAWMGLEINLLAFIPLMSDNKLMSTESSLKYFLTQALASSMLLFSMIIWFFFYNLIFIKSIIFSSFLLKMGSAPFHFWFPSVIEGLSWLNVLILTTWQKIAPLMLISYVILKPLIIISILLSSLVGALGGLNQSSMRKLMAYSSINHLSWMLSAMYYSNLLMFIYFFLYSLLNFSMIFLMNMFKISHINQLFSMFYYSKMMKFFMFFNFLSLGGLPPFLGFFPKWLIIQYMSMNNQLFLMTFMILMALITLYFYLRLCYTTFMLNYYENNWIMNSMYNSTFMKIFMTFSFFSLISLFLIYSLYLYL
uniref:NADH dehydrogenase subunit 2 n=1 Tax=Thelaira chrysopruinosa TaxID=3061172 RepID=UPI00286D34B7|nr:NADH dehydrogenase subunit 2 [Thelaira chrysopruinosa]WKF19259.1 NADH dehydrogenase subunit 2 [Thelaira chrysopruinosa]